jgi:hypothetical protein
MAWKILHFEHAHILASNRSIIPSLMPRPSSLSLIVNTHVVVVEEYMVDFMVTGQNHNEAMISINKIGKRKLEYN